MIRYILFICLTTGYINKAVCQNTVLFNSTDKRVLSNVVNDAVYILRQDYYLVDTTDSLKSKFGFNEKEYFGRFYFMAVLANGRFYTEVNINTPWKIDSNFDSINKVKKFKPELGSLAFSRIDSINFKSVSSAERQEKDMLSNLFNKYTSLKILDSTLTLKLANPIEQLIDSSIWVWVAKVPKTKFVNGRSELDTVKKIDFDVSKGKFNSTKKSYNTSSFYYSEGNIGGFLFSTKAVFSKIEFQLHGIVSKNKQGKFEMIQIAEISPVEKPVIVPVVTPIKSPPPTK